MASPITEINSSVSVNSTLPLLLLYILLLSEQVFTCNKRLNLLCFFVCTIKANLGLATTAHCSTKFLALEDLERCFYLVYRLSYEILPVWRRPLGFRHPAASDRLSGSGYKFWFPMPENMGVEFGTVFLSRIQAELWALPVWAAAMLFSSFCFV
jgi:hypothetical protein